MKSKIMNIIFWPLIGGKPNITFSKRESLLDVGCGKGAFINLLPKQWESRGCDIVDYGLNDNKITIGNFETMLLDKKFSIVRSSHSLEHSQNPKKFLKKMIEHTKKDGIIVILSPNSLSLSYRLFKKKWITLGVDSHYCIMNIPAVAGYLEKNRCKIIYRSTYSLLSSPGSFCSFFGKHNSVFTLMLASILFLPLILIEQISGRADSFIIYAKKI
jgi:SAM-dependent methyltransferase